MCLEAWSAKTIKNLPAPVLPLFQTKIRPTVFRRNIHDLRKKTGQKLFPKGMRPLPSIFEKIAPPKSEIQNRAYLCRPFKNDGIVAEWLGTGLQNLLQRFESARYLTKKAPRTVLAGLFHYIQSSGLQGKTASRFNRSMYCNDPTLFGCMKSPNNIGAARAVR